MKRRASEEGKEGGSEEERGRREAVKRRGEGGRQ